jgi:hypothetical protein
MHTMQTDQRLAVTVPSPTVDPWQTCAYTGTRYHFDTSEQTLQHHVKSIRVFSRIAIRMASNS